MTNIKNNSRIEYTKGDTFELSVSANTTIDAGSQLRFIIAESELADPVIDNTYNLNSSGDFTLYFSENNKNALLIGDYIYKMILQTIDGKIITQLSGDFVVKWGV